MSARRPSRWFVLLTALAVSLAVFAPAPAFAGGHAKKKQARSHRTAHAKKHAKRRVASKSVGSPTEGHLVGGVHLDDKPYLRIIEKYRPGDYRWGLPSLVGLIDRAARRVRKEFPGAVLSVGNLSKRDGGDIVRHASHESGRDADIGFYVKDRKGKPLYEDHLVRFRGDGTAPSWPGARFDDARNWSLVAALAGDPHTRIAYIFVSRELRARLLAYGKKVGTSPAVRRRAAELLHQPHDSLPHDDHFHLRIACPAHMKSCVEHPAPRRRRAVASKHRKRRRGHARSSTKASKATEKSHHPKPKRSARPKERPKKREAETTRAEPETPNLAPEIPGLDSVVIAAPRKDR